MEARTRTYLEGRFGDYYRRSGVSLPPAADRREWGHIPWSAGSTTMVRHQSLLDLGDLDDFLHRTAPRHVYFSSARFADPGAGSMDEKGWQSADLVFDLDADHLPGVDPEETSYAEMLAACKQELLHLLSFLDDDFGFEETRVVFSGGRGYHVDYVRAIDLDREGLIGTESNQGTTRRVLRHRGGWGARVHARLVDLAETLREMEETAALERLQELDGIGEGRAETILGQLRHNFDAIRAGNVEAGGPGTRILVDALAEEVIEAETAPIDEPVTTDTKRLIRLPGSLHGGSGLMVTPLDRAEIDDFRPLEDAIPDRFRGRDIRVTVTEPGTVTFDGDTFSIQEGMQSVEECLGVFLMTRGRAEKRTE